MITKIIDGEIIRKKEKEWADYYKKKENDYFEKKNKEKILEFIIKYFPYNINLYDCTIFRKFKIKYFNRFLKKELKKLDLSFVFDKKKDVLCLLNHVNRYVNIHATDSCANGILIMISEEEFDEKEYIDTYFDYNANLNIIIELINKIMKNKFNFIIIKKVRNYLVEDENKKINYFYYKYDK